MEQEGDGREGKPGPPQSSEGVTGFSSRDGETLLKLLVLLSLSKRYQGLWETLWSRTRRSLVWFDQNGGCWWSDTLTVQHDGGLGRRVKEGKTQETHLVYLNYGWGELLFPSKTMAQSRQRRLYGNVLNAPWVCGRTWTSFSHRIPKNPAELDQICKRPAVRC